MSTPRDTMGRRRERGWCASGLTMSSTRVQAMQRQWSGKRQRRTRAKPRKRTSGSARNELRIEPGAPQAPPLAPQASCWVKCVVLGGWWPNESSSFGAVSRVFPVNYGKRLSPIPIYGKPKIQLMVAATRTAEIDAARELAVTTRRAAGAAALRRARPRSRPPTGNTGTCPNRSARRRDDGDPIGLLWFSA